MSSDIVACLQLDKKLPSRIIIVKEINGCDSTFISSCVMSNCIKNKTAVFIVSTHNSLQHYHNIGLKMNYNLQKCIDLGLVEFYNLGEDCVNNLLSNESNSLKNVFVKLKTKILAMQEKHIVVNIILDGVSHLFNLQYSLKDVNLFCKQIFSLVMNCNNSFVICHSNDAFEDDVTHVMSNLLVYKAHTVVQVESLPSGWSADVSGHLTIIYPGQKFDNEHLYTMDFKPSRYLFKLFDRGVKLLAPGTV